LFNLVVLVLGKLSRTIILTKKSFMQRIKVFLKNFLGFSIVILAAFLWLSRFLGEGKVSKNGKKERVVMSENKRCVMTVFIHGTIVRYFSPSALIRALKGVHRKDSYKDTYRNFTHDYNESMRRASYYRLQAINRQGLVAVDPAEGKMQKEEFFASRVAARLYEDVARKVSKKRESHLFYTFGWSGDLREKQRRSAAEELYDALIQEVAEVREKYGTEVELHLVAHSHGGNVALLLAEEEGRKLKKLVVDKLILWGTPIQSETEGLAKSSIFHRVYHFYSLGDHVQIADFVSTQDLFSRRTFGGGTRSIEPDQKTAQVELQVGTHKPYHVELWLFGLAKFPYLFYRKNFPLHPLPMMVLTPAFVEMVDAAPSKGDFFAHVEKEREVCHFKLFSRDEKLKKDRTPIAPVVDINIDLLRKRAIEWIKG
jgi:pimeloyl-ACP methyl ester carboxylesterase